MHKKSLHISLTAYKSDSFQETLQIPSKVALKMMGSHCRKLRFSQMEQILTTKFLKIVEMLRALIKILRVLKKVMLVLRRVLRILRKVLRSLRKVKLFKMTKKVTQNFRILIILKRVKYSLLIFTRI
jgi:hypothetical protein